MVLRKLFARATKRAAPTWEVQEAANGETAAVVEAAAEDEEARLEQLRNSQPVEAQLGRLMVRKNMKIVDILIKWDTSGSGEVSKSEFRHHCRELGVVADSDAIDACFDSYDSVRRALHAQGRASAFARQHSPGGECAENVGCGRDRHSV